MAGIGHYNELIVSCPLFSHLLNDINQHSHEQEDSFDLHNQQSIINSTHSEKENETLTSSTSVEIKQKGKLKWGVYVAYLRAGGGIILGFLLVSVVSAIQQSIYIFSSWWLAAWNDDENSRYKMFNNCTTNNTIWWMTDQEWNYYRNRRFYIYSGLLNSFD
jgi:hypothetical protein